MLGWLIIQLDSYTISLRIYLSHFQKSTVKNSPPLVGGDEGEGGQNSSCPPPASPSPIRGEGIIWEISNIFG